MDEWCASHHGHLTVKKHHLVATDWVNLTAVLVNLKNTEIDLLPQLRIEPEFLGRTVCNTFPVANEPSLIFQQT
jgi:hypothetical protein